MVQPLSLPSYPQSPLTWYFRVQVSKSCILKAQFALFRLVKQLTSGWGGGKVEREGEREGRERVKRERGRDLVGHR